MTSTDTCIYAMSAADGFEPKLPLQDCAISVVLGELEWGVWRSGVERNRVVLDEWLTAVRVRDMNRTPDVATGGCEPTSR